MGKSPSDMASALKACAEAKIEHEELVEVGELCQHGYLPGERDDDGVLLCYYCHREEAGMPDVPQIPIVDLSGAADRKNRSRSLEKSAKRSSDARLATTRRHRKEGRNGRR